MDRNRPAARFRGAGLGVAMPGPFDYARGIGRFADVGKFAALAGVDIGAALSDGIGNGVRIRFSNDADAFAVGEWFACDEPRPTRLVGITLGTGVGTGFVADGQAITDGEPVPPEGSAYRLEIAGRPLEDTASSRAVLAAYNRGRKGKIMTVSELTALGRAGDADALEVFHHAWRAAAGALAPYIVAFGAEVVVVGGAIARSWDLVRPALLDGLRDAAPELPASIDLRRAADPEAAALLGAAFTASASW
ncbi:ROK family protein [Microlunatus sp. Gsoil 973]|uniref:ROK family protein n=1 Tax=Microlunatus sp. Gsoil 973 TaxID=2672569 RepID=UPI0012B4DF58|nr:ROK family protein [Microlunatus sp. Gsoil 973]QGN33204.1 ROK family protein [Microlunatus sp. Gsoil 973]